MIVSCCCRITHSGAYNKKKGITEHLLSPLIFLVWKRAAVEQTAAKKKDVT